MAGGSASGLPSHSELPWEGEKERERERQRDGETEREIERSIRSLERQGF